MQNKKEIAMSIESNEKTMKEEDKTYHANNVFTPAFPVFSYFTPFITGSLITGPIGLNLINGLPQQLLLERSTKTLISNVAKSLSNFLHDVTADQAEMSNNELLTSDDMDLYA